MLKNYKKPRLLFFLLCLFHFIGNLIWIRFNRMPPSWDQSHHTLYAFYAYEFFHNVFTGKFQTYSFIHALSDAYGPLVRIAAGLMLLILQPSIKVTQLTSTLFFLGSLYLIYLIGKQIFKNEWLGLLAAFFFSFYQVIYDYSRWLMLDIPLTFFVLLTFYFIYNSNYFANKKNTTLAFISITLVALTKIQGLIYVLFFLLHNFYVIIKMKKLTRLKNIIVGIVLFIIFVIPWILLNKDSLIDYSRWVNTAEPYVDPISLCQLTTWIHYLNLFINWAITPFSFLLFLIALFSYIKKARGKYKKIVLLIVIVYYFIWTIIPNKDLRFLFPILPFTAFIFAEGLLVFGKNFKNISKLILTLIVSYNVFLYLVLSFAYPLRKGLMKAWDLPIIGTIYYLNLSDYPVHQYDDRLWPHLTIIKDLALENKGAKTLIIFDNENINTNNLLLLSFIEKDYQLGFTKPYEFIGLNENLVFYIDSFDYYLLASDDISPYWLNNKKSIDLTREYFVKNINRFSLIKSYRSPNNNQLLLFKK